MKPPSFLRRRPSAAMVVAITALVVASGGAGYAASFLPPNSVGSAQIKNGAVSNWKLASNAVGFRKIIPHTIGRVRVDQNAIQLRVSGSCTNPGQAMTSIANNGKASCGNTAPLEFNTPGLTAKLASSTAGSLVASEALPPGSAYLVTAAPYIEIGGTAGSDQQVAVTCELADGSVSQTRTATFQLTSSAENQAAEIPLVINVPSGGAPTNAAVGCIRGFSGSGAAPGVNASGPIDAIQTAANTSVATPTTTTPYSVTTTTPTPTTTTTATTTATGTTTTH